MAQRLIRRLTELDDCETATAALTDKKKRSRKQTERRKFRRRRRRRRRPLVWNNKTIETLLSVRRGSISMSSTRARMNCTRANNIANSLSLFLCHLQTHSLYFSNTHRFPHLSLYLYLTPHPPLSDFRPFFLHNKHKLTFSVSDALLSQHFCTIRNEKEIEGRLSHTLSHFHSLSLSLSQFPSLFFAFKLCEKKLLRLIFPSFLSLASAVLILLTKIVFVCASLSLTLSSSVTRLGEF